MRNENNTNVQGLTPATLDFKESSKIDPTHGWIPFALVMAIVPFILAVIIMAGYLIIG